MPVPLNSVAETIQDIEEVSARLELSIAEFQAKLEKNTATIAQLEPLAEWGPDPVEPQVPSEAESAANG